MALRPPGLVACYPYCNEPKLLQVIRGVNGASNDNPVIVPSTVVLALIEAGGPANVIDTEPEPSPVRLASATSVFPFAAIVGDDVPTTAPAAL